MVFQTVPPASLLTHNGGLSCYSYLLLSGTQKSISALLTDHKITIMKKSVVVSLLIALIAVSPVRGYGVTPSSTSRRQVMGAIFGGSVAFVGATAANALDMDAFANAQIESDTKNCDPKKDPKCVPKLSKDEALCKYGQSGKARGEACQRVKAAGGEVPSAQPQGKSLGGAYAM